MAKVKNHILLWFFIVILLSIFFRFYKLHDFLIFGMDQENEILIVKNIASGKHFPLIGLSSSDTGIYRGPLFLYFEAIPYILFNGNPIGGALTAALLGVIVSFLIYRLGSKMFSPAIGFFGALFYSGSFLVAYYDRQFWNPSFVGLLSLLIGYLCFKTITSKSYSVAIILVVLFGIATHAHLAILIFVPLIIWVLWRIRNKLSVKKVLFLLLLLFVTQLPLVVFDFRHNFLNSKALINALTQSSVTRINTSFSERSTLFLSTLGRYLWVPPVADFLVESGQCKELLPFMKNQKNAGIALISFILICFFSWRYKKKPDPNIAKGLYIPLSLGLISIIFVSFYKNLIFPYYFSFLFPWLSLLLGWCVVFIWRQRKIKYIVVPGVLLFVFLNVLTLVTSKYSFSYYDKESALHFVSKQIGQSPYSLEALGECPRYGGQRYLAEYLVNPPIHSYMDSYFAWLYPDAIKDIPKATIVILSMIDSRMNEDLISNWEKLKVGYLRDYNLSANERFGKIQVLILSKNN